MKAHPNPKVAVPVLLLILAAAAVWWYLGSGRATAAVAVSGRLEASGAIEAVQVTIAPELGGRVIAVLVEEGDRVTAGQALVRFDDRLLSAQKRQAEAALRLAEANYDLVAAGPAEEQQRAAIAAAELEVTAAQQALDDLDEKQGLITASAGQAVAAAEKALDRADQRLDSITGAADPVDVDAARAAVVLAKDKLDKAREDFGPYKKKPEDNLVRARLQGRLAEVQNQYDALVSRLNNLLGKANQYDLNLAQADQALAKAQLEDALHEYEQVKDGPDPEALRLARERLSAAQARLVAAQTGAAPEQLSVAQAQVDAARAALDVLQAQDEKLAINAPISGVVLSRSVEPGEIALTGAPILVLADIERLTVTVWVPEDRYGVIEAGQLARVTSDSFPGTTFTARVIKIADQAEFTPRNVQTEEGRRTMVFAVKLALENAGDRLKPGMPVDVDFGNP